MASVMSNSNSSSNSNTLSISNAISNGLLTLNLNQQQTLASNIVLIAKFDYKSKEPNELDLRKNERVVLIDNTKNWWLVRKLDNEHLTGFVPSNYVKKEKKSLLEKIIPRKLHHISHSCNFESNHKPVNNNVQHQVTPANNPTRAVVKHKYTGNKSDELTLNTGARVVVLEKFSDGWWKVLSDDNQSQSIGLYPSNYLQEEPSSNLKLKNSTSLENQMSQRSNLDNSNPNLDSSFPKCESISSNEKELEYLRVIYSFSSSINNNELSVSINEILKLVEDDTDCLDYDKSWIKVFNSQGITGVIPSKCVEPILDNQLNDFVFIRRPTCIGSLANNIWYFGNITRFETILLLNKYAANGDYLVRDSENGDLSISLKSDSINNKHFKVFFKDSKYLIGKKVFGAMQELLDHYHKNAIYDQNGEKLYLIKPFEPPSFDSLFL